jgi:hypothetical protein
MADENKPAFYPRVGRTIAKNFRSAQPAPFINDPRAMELPFEYGDEKPTPERLELDRRQGARIADLARQKSADTSPLEKAAGALQAVRFMGSALTQAINSLPTRIAKGDAAAEKFMEERMYKPEQPLAYEYAQDIGDFLEKLETQYKIPPVLPEAMALQFLTGPATSQAMRTAGRGAEQAGRAMERRMEPVVRGALEQGGLPREMVMAMGANTQSNVVKPKGGNWFDDTLNRSVQDLKKTDRGIPFSDEDVTYLESEIERLRNGNLQNEMVQENIRRLQGDIAMNKQESALNNWLDNTFKNYVKNEMATPEDRVRKMFDRRTEDVEKLEAKYEKDITKLETKLANAKAQPQSRERDQAIAYLERDIENKIQDLNFDVDTASKTIGHIRDLESEARYPQHGVISVREDRGFPTEGMATSTIGKGWENLTDSLLGMKKAGRIGRLPETEERYPWLESVDPEAMVYKTLSGLTRDTGIDHVLDVLRQDVRSGAITPEQLSKITMDQAVERTANFDRAAAVKMRKTAIQNTEGFPTYKEYPAGYKWIELAPPKELPAGYKVIQSDIGEGFKVVDADGNDAVSTALRPTNNLGHTNIPFHKTEEEAIADALKFDKRLEKALKYEGDTMGHCVGGYCPDVQEGRTRIFSLRDRRGEPHVTVEVQPQQHLDYNTWFNKQPEEIQDRIAQRRIQDKNHDVYEGPEYLAAREALPPIVNQIKGKQNLRPIEKYDPYTQDFVKSGVFSDVRDLENTGLYKADPNELGMYLPKAEDIRDLPVKRSDLFSRAQQAGLFPEGQKYLNRNEWEDILRRQYQAENPPKPDVPPDLEGMKRGGKVSISNNPDTMMMELGNKRMKEGGSEDDTKPYFGGAGTKKYAAAKKRAEEVEPIKERFPKTSAAVMGLTGTRPDEMGFSVLDPEYKEIMDVADPAFYAGTALGIAPLGKALNAPFAAIGKALEPAVGRFVTKTMERGGLGADILTDMGRGTRSYAYLPHTEKSPNPLVGTRYKTQHVGNLTPKYDFNIQAEQGSSVMSNPWDLTSRGEKVLEVSDIPMSNQMITEGGHDFARDLANIQANIGGASGRQIAERMQDRVNDATFANLFDRGTGRVFTMPSTMDVKGSHFSTMPTDLVMDIFQQAGLKPKDVNRITDDLRTFMFETEKGKFRNAAPVGSPEFMLQLRQGGKGFSAGDLRKGLMDRMSKSEYQKMLGFNIEDVYGAIGDQSLKGLPKGFVGNTMIETSPFAGLKPATHQSYDTANMGKYAGSMPSMPLELMMPDLFRSLEINYLKNPKYQKLTPLQLRTMIVNTIEKRGNVISQPINQRVVDNVMRYKQGLAQGHFQPNDYDSIMEFMRRTGGYKDGGAVHKAEGGEVSGDDLILEERPL